MRITVATMTSMLYPLAEIILGTARTTLSPIRLWPRRLHTVAAKHVAAAGGIRKFLTYENITTPHPYREALIVTIPNSTSW